MFVYLTLWQTTYEFLYRHYNVISHLLYNIGVIVPKL